MASGFGARAIRVGYCERGRRLFSWVGALVDFLCDFYGFDGVVDTDFGLCSLQYAFDEVFV